MVETELTAGGWTHWLKIPYITYIDGELGSAPEEKKIWDALYAKIGNPYGVAGLMGNLYAESGLRPDNLQTRYEASLGYPDPSYTAAVDSGAYANFTPDSAGSVSYTHLDVYKRQALFMRPTARISPNKPQRSCKNRSMIPALRLCTVSRSSPCPPVTVREKTAG